MATLQGSVAEGWMALAGRKAKLHTADDYTERGLTPTIGRDAACSTNRQTAGFVCFKAIGWKHVVVRLGMKRATVLVLGYGRIFYS